MFDNLREQANNSPFYDDDDAQFQQDQGSGEGVVPLRISSSRPFLGMTPPQRFIVAAMLMIVVCVLGVVVLLVTGRIGLL